MTDKSQDKIEALEAQFPPASGVAFSQARAQVIASGQSVLVTEDDVIYEVSPSGERTFIKKIDPPVDVTLHQKMELT